MTLQRLWFLWNLGGLVGQAVGQLLGPEQFNIAFAVLEAMSTGALLVIVRFHVYRREP